MVKNPLKVKLTCPGSESAFWGRLLFVSGFGKLPFQASGLSMDELYSDGINRKTARQTMHCC